MDNMDFFANTIMSACRLVIKYNTVTSEIHFLKSTLEADLDEGKTIYARSYIEELLKSDVIYKDDEPLFKELLEKNVIHELSMAHQNGALIVYRRKLGEKLIYTRLNMFVPADYSIDNPYVTILTRDMPDAEATMYEAWGILGEQVHKVVKINLTTDESQTLKEYPSETLLRKRNHTEGFSNEVAYTKEVFVHSTDEEAYMRYLNTEYIRNYFKEGNSDFRFFYRRKVRGLYRWVRLSIYPASEYEENNEVYYVYVRDVHKTILKILDINAATNYAHYFAKRSKSFSEGYYENLLEILSTFTEPYVDYYMIDLEKDLYINYKLSHNNINVGIPYIGDYTKITEEYLADNFSKEQREVLDLYSSSEKIRNLLRDKMTLKYSFKYPTGMEVETTIVKIEAKDGIPTKVICSTLPVINQKKLIVRTFGNFEVFHPDGTPFDFSGKQSKQLLAYLIDRQGYPVTSKDIVVDILEKEPSDIKAIKYVSTLIRRAMKEMEDSGYPDVIVKEHKSVRVNIDEIDCDYYHILDGDFSYWEKYHNEYMKEYSWAEETNAELLSITNI